MEFEFNYYLINNLDTYLYLYLLLLLLLSLLELSLDKAQLLLWESNEEEMRNKLLFILLLLPDKQLINSSL